MSLAMHSAIARACARAMLLEVPPPSLDYSYILASIIYRYHVQEHKFSVGIFAVIFYGKTVIYYSFA